MSFGYRILWVGRKAQDPLLAAADDYAERLARYAGLERVLVRDSDIQTEGDALLSRLKPSDFVIAMDERGETPTTVELSTKVRSWAELGRSVVFVLGGADGLRADVKARANALMALSRMTMPHRLAQVVLLEQLYRAHTILRGEKYHRV